MNSFKEELQDLSDFVRRFAFWRTLLMIQIGCFIFGCVVSGILIPQNFFAGGLMGISLLILTLSGDWISLSLLYILLNLPLFLLGYRSFSLRFLVISLMGMGILSLNLEWTEGMNIPTREPLLAAILGGILSGAGSGLYLRFGGSVGGLDILGAFLKKKFSIPIGNTFILVNLVIIAANGLLYDLDIALYTGIFMYVFSWALQRVQTGFSQRKAVFIISKKPEEVADKVLRKMDRGLT
ncbi:MAG: YitT family protein, partial [SAR324 cluster bacterium]|nr:YitT family protein [SAR324 cluster bacterium]